MLLALRDGRALQHEPAPAEDRGRDERVARAYFAAYEARDVERLQEYLHPDAVYEDPTASLLGAPIHVADAPASSSSSRRCSRARRSSSSR